MKDKGIGREIKEEQKVGRNSDVNEVRTDMDGTKNS